MPDFIVRLNCEYSIDIEAKDADEAMEKASQIDCAEWMQAWSPIEAEEA